MKKLESGRTEYQEFLYSLFIKYGIDSPDELWSNSVWKVIVDNRVSNYARENFYKELSEFNIKNPSDENRIVRVGAIEGSAIEQLSPVLGGLIVHLK